MEALTVTKSSKVKLIHYGQFSLTMLASCFGLPFPKSEIILSFVTETEEQVTRTQFYPFQFKPLAGWFTDETTWPKDRSFQDLPLRAERVVVRDLGRADRRQ
jgi:hypothetical protein